MNEKIGQRIYNLRTDKDLYQKDIATLLKISQQYYSEYETGKRELPLRHLHTLCAYYDISADYILGFIDEPRRINNQE